MGSRPLRMKVRWGCPPRVLSPPPHRTQSWRPCLPGQPWASGWRSTDRPVPSPCGWTIGFSERGAAHNRALPRCLFSRRCMRSWRVRGMAPFTARSRSSASSVLTTLDGGVAREYAGIPQVERVVAVHLCPRNAATWRNRPRLPSKACKLTTALAAKAYSAAGQAASALHAMDILQVHQAKALKQVHEGSTDPGLMQELRTATDFALRATKVMARSLGKAMSTMVVQERHLWLNLAEMKDVDKAPSRRPHLPGRAVRWHRRGLRPAVLGGTAADRGDPAHPAPLWCTIHRCPWGQASVCPSPWAPSCVLQSCSAPGRIGEDPRRCTIGVVLSFLQERLERRLSPSTLKVYVAAIAAHHDAVDGRSLGKHDLIVRFLKGARRMNPSRPPLVPSWDLSIVLAGLQRGPFGPLDSVELKFLSLKTALLTALTSIKRVGDLQAFSVSEECLVFGPVYSHVVLRPRPGYVLKVPTTPFRDQVVNLQALPSEEADPALALLCPVRALRIYVTRTRSVRSSEQLFVCHGGQQKGKAVSKQRLAHWIVEAIALEYQSQGEPCPLGGEGSLHQECCLLPCVGARCLFGRHLQSCGLGDTEHLRKILPSSRWASFFPCIG